MRTLTLNLAMDLTLPLLLSTLAAMPCFLLLFRAWKAVARQRAPLPPGPRGWPVLGNLPQLGGKTHQTLHEMAKV
jgi:flavonoid 3'-monooxygenase